MDRKTVTFAQAEGAEPLPTQLKVGEVSGELRAKLWRIIYLYLDEDRTSFDYFPDTIGGKWEVVLQSWHVDAQHKLYDEFDDHLDVVVDWVKKIIQHGTYIEVFHFLQFVIRHSKCPSNFARYIDDALTDCRAGYRVIEKTIMPISEPEEVSALQRDLAEVRASPFAGAYSHLKNAIGQLSEGEFAASIRESIHAVESACRKLEPSASTLGPALKKLSSKGDLHPALQGAFEKLYGYTSDAEGVRHALVMNDAASVDEAEAIFFLSSCAAFVGFLSRKAAP